MLCCPQSGQHSILGFEFNCTDVLKLARLLRLETQKSRKLFLQAALEGFLCLAQLFLREAKDPATEPISIDRLDKDLLYYLGRSPLRRYT